ncbi:VOC family protein [Paenibacillus profundus]|uniref:VOC family protein n=1 Tax=Paenibacillus profundus TaxID=1173085 RepID=A0ABS8YGK2_9BACL|nr:VOC family protein [Paenibacillus profundus]MCE5171108.1 VOC family protein [Paenibacillus profundus]
MLKRLECVALYTPNMEASVEFYTTLGLTENWRIERNIGEGRTWILVGLKFPDEKSSELVLQNNPELNVTDIELYVEDVRDVYQSLSDRSDIQWIREPFPTESGHVAVMEAPDQNVFVLVGK